jgi:hypothetical protein
MRHFWILADLTPQNRNNLLTALAILMLLVVVGGFAILMVRRRLNAEDDPASSESVGFSLSDLRAMRDRGEITAQEYEITKARVIDKVKANMAAREKKQKPTGGFPITPPDEQPPA